MPESPDLARSPDSRALRRLLRGMGVSLVTLVVLVATLEAGARLLLAPPVAFDSMIYDVELGFRQRSDQSIPAVDEHGTFPFVLNGSGFRGPDLPDGPAPAGTQRLLFLGDSFVQAWGVRDEDHLALATRDLLVESGWAAESYTAHCDGYGNAQELLLLRAHGARVQPDVVIVMVYLPNDVVNNSRELCGVTGMSGGDFFRPYLSAADGWKEPSFALPGRAALRHSRLFQQYESWSVHRMSPLERRELITGSPIPTIEERLAQGLLFLERYEAFRAPPPDGMWARAWATTRNLLTTLRDESAALGARFLVVAIPSMHQVQNDAALRDLDARVLARTGATMSARVDWNRPERWLSDVAAEEGMDVLLLLPHLRAELARTGGSLYLRNQHLLGPAHRLAARLIAAQLLETSNGDAPTLEQWPDPVATTARDLDREGFVDVRAAPHRELFARGWHDGSVPDLERGGGWPLEQDGTVLGPDGTGTLVLRGFLAEAAPVPLELRVGWAGAWVQDITLERTGPAELRAQVVATGHPTGLTLVRLRAERALARMASFQLESIELVPSPGG